MDVSLNFRMPVEQEAYESAIYGHLYRRILKELPKEISERFGIDENEVYNLIRKIRLELGLKE